MPLAAWLLSMVGPLALRVLSAVGIGLVTYTGASSGMDALINLAVSSWSGVPADVLQLASLAGIPQAIGMICGAFSTRVATWVAVQAKRVVWGG